MNLEFHARMPYSYQPEGHRSSVPTLWLVVEGMARRAIEGILDSGSERTVVDGRCASDVGLDLTSGSPCVLTTATGHLQAYLHTVRISLDPAGHIDALPDVPELFQARSMPVAFTLDPLPRNLLGRDFFEHFRICFDEREQLVYLGVRDRVLRWPRPSDLAA